MKFALAVVVSACLIYFFGGYLAWAAAGALVGSFFGVAGFGDAIGGAIPGAVVAMLVKRAFFPNPTGTGKAGSPGVAATGPVPSKESAFAMRRRRRQAEAVAAAQGRQPATKQRDD